jgi:2-polyprenyl-6-methoxyphenol hydroxylase-like FAD-dependent oxidoreductase
MSMFLGSKGVRVLFQMPGDRSRVYLQMTPGEFSSVGVPGLPRWLEGVLREVPALERIGEPLRRGEYDFQLASAWQLSVSTWSGPGFALLGDAAHAVHPLAGQGMNSAIADAWVLAGELSSTGTRDEGAVDRALRRYQQVRASEMAYISRLSRNLASLFTSTSRVARTVRPLMLRRNRDNRRLQYRLTRNVSGLSANPFTLWDWACASGLVRDPRAHELPCGEALPAGLVGPHVTARTRSPGLGARDQEPRA